MGFHSEGGSGTHLRFVVLWYKEGVCTTTVASSVDIARGIKIEMGREREYEGWGT